ncbi:aspartyl protease family protein At5g10770-like [Arachis stenosperma]|uniref:aspartyl protease family protein At5g10770-like n=1 Tax=Arachis stenosperma TaxID=217475 RepID=UPI0025ABAAB8|nr:aspartyl protease family protein At5g10770-like [Arachis stenosperma]
MGNFHLFLLCILALNFVLDSVLKSVAFQSDDTTTTQISNHFNVVEVSSLLPTSTCNPSSKQDFLFGLNYVVSSEEEEESLELVHNYGPCSPKNHGKANAPSMLEILDRDQKRASLMVSRQRYGKNQVQLRWQDSTYVINVGIGTPKRMFTFNIDTGYTQCVSSSCTYLGAYLDGSLIFGYMAKETLFVGSKTFKGIMFGCNEVTFNATLDKTDGIIGLGQGFLSFVEQTSNTYNKVFSYCLPSNPNRVGFLRFGKTKQVSKSLKFTKLGRDNAIELTGIKVGSTTIPITVKKDTAFIDSGTVITRLPSKDYIKLREAYRKAMTGYSFVGAISVADTCYNVGDHKKLKLPKMSFLFEDGLVLNIPPSGVVIPYNSTVVCFPFAATPETPGGEDFVLLGNYQQKTLEVVYDVAGGKLGFGHGGCK